MRGRREGREGRETGERSEASFIIRHLCPPRGGAEVWMRLKHGMANRNRVTGAVFIKNKVVCDSIVAMDPGEVERIRESSTRSGEG